LGGVVRSPKDFWLGVIYTLVGAAGFLIARDYPFGSGARMGAGYFPTIISSLLFVFGIVSIGRSFFLNGQTISAIAWKALLLIIGSAVTFAVLVDRAGFVVAALALLLLCATASEQFRFSWTAILGALVLVICCTLLFINGLGLPMPTIGPWLLSIVPDSLGR
jgi:Tripartite tricarboxylate transporter TctB family